MRKGAPAPVGNGRGHRFSSFLRDAGGGGYGSGGSRRPTAGGVGFGVTGGLVKLDLATRMLAEICTVDDAKQLIDLAEAARVYARQADLGLEAQNHAAEIKLRAQRRAGEVLREMQKAKGTVLDGRDDNGNFRRLEPPTADNSPTYAELGIEKHAAHDWQTIAAMPEGEFEEHIAETKAMGQELTTAGLVRAAKHNPPHISRNSGNNEWYTPPEIIAAVHSVMDYIDLDPASTPEANAVVGANKFYTAYDDGLQFQWQGRVFMNPPYASELIPLFASKLKRHAMEGDVVEAVVLVNNATETAWFGDLVEVASAVCFPRGRVKFWSSNGNSAAPLQGQAIIYIGENVERFSEIFSRFGWIAVVL